MKVRTNWLVQGLGIAVQVLNTAGGLPLLPVKAQPWLAAGVGFAQLLAAIMGHHSNLDGTPIAKAEAR